MRSVLALHNCSKSLLPNLDQVLLHLSLIRIPDILLTLPQRLDLEVEFLPTLDMQAFYPSLAHNYDNYTHHDPLIDRSCRRVVAVSVQISVANGNCLSHVFSLLDR